MEVMKNTYCNCSANCVYLGGSLTGAYVIERLPLFHPCTQKQHYQGSETLHFKNRVIFIRCMYFCHYCDKATRFTLFLKKAISLLHQNKVQLLCIRHTASLLVSLFPRAHTVCSVLLWDDWQLVVLTVGVQESLSALLLSSHSQCYSFAPAKQQNTPWQSCYLN